MMERHPTDFIELLFGLAFVAIGGGFIAHQETNGGFDGTWIAAIALVVVGTAFLAATLVHRPRLQPPAEPAYVSPVHATAPNATATATNATATVETATVTDETTAGASATDPGPGDGEDAEQD